MAHVLSTQVQRFKTLSEVIVAAKRRTCRARLRHVGGTSRTINTEGWTMSSQRKYTEGVRAAEPVNLNEVPLGGFY